MAPVEGNPAVFAVVVHLPPGCVVRAARTARGQRRSHMISGVTCTQQACGGGAAAQPWEAHCHCHAAQHTGGVPSVAPHLPAAARARGRRYHQYKFIVDGKWRHDETAPFMPDPLGNVNNWLFVRRIDPPRCAWHLANWALVSPGMLVWWGKKPACSNTMPCKPISTYAVRMLPHCVSMQLCAIL